MRNTNPIDLSTVPDLPDNYTMATKPLYALVKTSRELHDETKQTYLSYFTCHRLARKAQQRSVANEPSSSSLHLYRIVNVEPLTPVPSDLIFGQALPKAKAA